MTRLLQVNSSLFSTSGKSSALANAFADRFRALYPGTRTVVRNLTPSTMPHLDEETFAAFTTPPEQRSPRQRQQVALSDELIGELKSADLIVLGLPMYNFGLPSTLKAWFDHVARAGITFRYTENGPEGLLRGKRAVIASARGGKYSGDDDNQTPHVRQFLSFLGIDDVTTVHAEGLAMGDDAEQTMARARNDLERLATTI